MSKKFLVLALSVLMVLCMTTASFAFDEGDTISASGLTAEFGTKLISVTAAGESTSTALTNSNSTKFFTHRENKESGKETAQYVADTDMGETVVELKSDQLVSYNGTGQSFWNGTNYGTTANFQGTTVNLNKSYLGVAAAPSGYSNATYTLNTDVNQEYVFTVMFKAPKASNISTWLFGSWNNMSSLNYEMLRGGMLFDQGIEITNGFVYIYATGYSGNAGTALNTTALDGDTWYKAVRIMKFPKNAKASEKVLILGKNASTDEYDTVVAASDFSEFQASNMSSSNGNRFGNMMFITDYPADYSGTTTKITDYATYEASGYSKTVVSDAPKSRVMEADFTGTGTRECAVNKTYDMVYVSDRLNNKTGKSLSTYVTFMLPDVGEESLAKFFRFNLSNAGKQSGVPGNNTSDVANAPFPDSYAASILGNTLYANVYSTSSTLDGVERSKSWTNLTALSTDVYYTQQAVYTELTAGKWYTLELIRNNITSSTGVNTLKLYEGKVSRDENNAVTGDVIASWGNGTDQIFSLPYISAESNAEINQKTVETYMSGAKYSDAVYIDALDLRTFKDADLSGTLYSSGSYGVLDNWLTGYTSKSNTWGASLGVDALWHTFRLYGNSGNDPQEDTFCDNFIKIAEIVGDDYLKTGTIDHTDAEDIIITYNAPVDYTPGMVSLTNTAGDYIGADVDYDEETYTITVDITDTLDWGMTYTLTIDDATTELLGYTVEGGSYTFTCADLFTASDLAILDSLGDAVSVSQSLAAGDYTAKATLVNDSPDRRTYVLILALYKDNQMIDVAALSGEIAAGRTLSPETDAITVGETGCTAKVMVWDSWTDIAPKVSALVVPQQ